MHKGPRSLRPDAKGTCKVMLERSGWAGHLGPLCWPEFAVSRGRCRATERLSSGPPRGLTSIPSPIYSAEVRAGVQLTVRRGVARLVLQVVVTAEG